MNDIQELFKGKEYCCQVIEDARSLWSDISITEQKFNTIFNTLGMALIHCPPEMISLIKGAIYEATLRERYFITEIWNKS